MKQYVCVNENGEMIGVDISSGSYPYSAEGDLNLVKFWDSKEKADEYADYFEKLTVKEFTFTLTDPHLITV